MANAKATYSGEELEVIFKGNIEKHEEGDIVTDIEVEQATLLGTLLTFRNLSEGLQAKIIALAEDLDFEYGEPNYEDLRE